MPEGDRVTTKEESFELKQDARDSRLSIKKTQEERFYKKFREEAMTLCKPEAHAFAECAKKEGFWVVFQCRAQNAAMAACLEQHINEPKFEEYLDKQGYVRPPGHEVKKGFFK